MKISKFIQQLIKNDPQLSFFLSRKLLNLTQYAMHIKPLIEGHMKKDIPISTIVMALSRIQKKKSSTMLREKKEFKVKEVKIYTDLCTMSFNKSPKIHQDIQKLYNSAMRKSVYFTIAESTTEITFITKKVFLATQKVPIPKYKHMELSAITLRFDPKYLDTPGIITNMLQQLTYVDINFIEIASTCTEISIYVDRMDLKLAVDTLSNKYVYYK